MALIEHIKQNLKETQECFHIVQKYMQDPLVWQAFYNDFEYRFCWSSNHLEGNTLSLDETIAVVDFDEVDAKHTYSEYQQAKNLYRAIKQMRFGKVDVTGKWIRDANATICGTDGIYRTSDVFIGGASGAVYYPPEHKQIPLLMQEFLVEMQGQYNIEGFSKIIENAANMHIRFERIHPFMDGNGRTGRMILNQMLMNRGLLPVAIMSTSKYRQAFKAYDLKQDNSMLVYLICDAMDKSAELLEQFSNKKEQDRKEQKKAVSKSKPQKGRER